MASIFWFIVLIGILIFAHEGGHFLFAKLFRVKVLTFCLGFGKPIRFGKFKLSWKPGETEYRIAWFPAGGFVRMLGDDPTEEVAADDRARAFSTQKAWKRFLIILGGPLFSIMLAVPTYFVVNIAKSRAPDPVVGLVEPDSPAFLAGIQAGDVVLSVDGEEVATWEDVESTVQSSDGSPVEVVVDRAGQELSRTVKPREKVDETGLKLLGEQWELGFEHVRQGLKIGVVPDSPADRAGLRSWSQVHEVCGVPVRGWADIQRLLEANGDRPLPVTAVYGDKVEVGAISITVPVVLDTVIWPEPPEKAPDGTWHTDTAYTGMEPVDLYIYSVKDGSPADKLKIKPGDKIVAVGGRGIRSWEQFSRAILAAPDEKPLPLQIRHGTVVRDLEFTPETISQPTEFKQTIKKRGLGVTYHANYEGGVMIPRANRLGYATKMAFVDTGVAIYINVVGFVRIFEGRVKATEAIGGPLMIANIAGKSAQKGWKYFVRMMAMLSVLLGLLNLLPIPILDGGHIAFIGIETIIRRPLSVTVRVVASYVGLIILVGLMMFAFGNDIHRYWEEITSIFS